MGVSYRSCAKCDFGYRSDSEGIIYCVECHSNFCSKKCAKPIMEGYTDQYDDYDEYCIKCCICRKEFCNDALLVNFLLDHFKLTRKEAEKLYRKGDK